MPRSHQPAAHQPTSRKTRGAAILGWMASALLILLVPAGAIIPAMADSPSMDPTATPPAYERPIIAANMQCQGGVKVAGGTAQPGPYAEMQARHTAIETWRSQVLESHGADFTQWWRARDKDVACQASAGGVRCDALAVPCMAQGGSATMSGLGMGGANLESASVGGAGRGTAVTGTAGMGTNGKGSTGAGANRMGLGAGVVGHSR